MKVLNGLDLAGQRITSLGDPSGATDAASKQYVDNVARGLYWKQPVRAASTGNISVSAPGTTLDGVTLAANDRILLKNQTTGSENGLYVWTGGSTALTRTNDADSGAELNPGTAVTVTEGTTNADKVFMVISDAAVTIGTTATTWAQFGGGQTYTGSNGVQLSGSNFSGVAAAGGGLTVGASGFSIDTSVVTRKVSGTLGNGTLTTIAVTHSLGTQDVQVSLRDASTNAFVLTDWVATDVNTVTFSFATAPASGAYRWTIEG
ncbi:head decoration protein [Methylobacterium sp. 17Sr1-1]|uniref:head decoration protein n=1 Tax=Methylobacterium sp. 17Sr1-1 TaxID=2202826 RepID=UPI000D6F95E5|nr:head decoration protein [Methylobacterium sp. 17Sr1-1]AWN55073.1 head decoration protein [Methylobacterium sp. 17Sr1-1]